MSYYNPVVPTNVDLREELEDKLSNEFEDNIVIVFGKYIEDTELDNATYRAIAKRYEEAKAMYIDTLAAVIMYPDSLDYLD